MNAIIISNRLIQVACLAFLLACSAIGVRAQSSTEGQTPLGLSPGSPSGSYPLSGFETVNLFNGNLNFQMSLLNIGGRGGTSFPITVHIDQKWTISKEVNPGHNAFYFGHSTWWSENDGGNHTITCGRLKIRRGALQTSGGVSLGLTRVTFTAPDGTEYELRDQLTGGQPVVPGGATGFNRQKIFISADGTAATFISDSDVIDVRGYGDNELEYPASGYLMLRDGTRFRIDDDKVSWMRDRNGNKVTFGYDFYKRVISITDSLNRHITVTYDIGSQSSTTTYDQIDFKGFGGAARTIRIGHCLRSDAMRSDLAGTNPTFPGLTGFDNPNPPVINYIELPDGRRYQIQYNQYAEIARFVMPTGGAIEYDWAKGLTDGDASGIFTLSLDKYVYRRVIERRMYPDGGSGPNYETRMTYSRPEASTGTAPNNIVAEQSTPSGVVLAHSLHYFYGSARDSFGKKATDYPSWQESKEYKTETFENGGTMLVRRNENTFEQRAAVSWWTGGSATEPPNDVRANQMVTTLVDTNQVLKQTFGYDDSVAFNNQNNVKEYDFGSGTAGNLLRETRTTFLTDASYTGTDVHLRVLPVEISIYDGTGIRRAKSTIEYDNYTATSGHATLTPRASIASLCAYFDASGNCFAPDDPIHPPASYTTRGNATTTTAYSLNTSGQETGSTITYSQYDIAGNVVKAIDARGYATLFDFSDRFGAPDGNARLNSGADELNAPGLYSYAFPTLTTNALGHTAYKQFDYYLGRPVDAEDANGIVFSGYSDNDALDRPTKVISAANQSSSIKSQTIFVYDDVNHLITTASDQTVFNDPAPLKSQIVYDGWGRTTESRTYENSTDYIAVQQVPFAVEQDPDTSAWVTATKSSNPFRPYLSEQPVWTTGFKDTFGRTTKVRTPDSAIVRTSYSGNTATATDQAGKARKSLTDALGRITTVYEDPAGLNYSTSYSYDVFDNLLTVDQGTQSRTFVYDSLKRLISATNPESGTIAYQYDANGNLSQRTDARGVVSTYMYDALNRNTSLTYTNDPAGTPGVTRTYDQAPNGIGRLWSTQTGGNSSSVTAIDSYDALGRPLAQHEEFWWVAGGHSTYRSYTIQRTYDHAGHALTQTYPSGHTVNYAYDQAGRTSSYAGNLGDGVARTYANEFQYTERGGLQQEKFGTDTPLYHKQRFNLRGQVWDMRLSTVAFATDPADGNRGAIVNYYSNNFVPGGSSADNNSDLLRQEISIPGSGFFQDNFAYDSLNRLTSISEKLNGGGNDTFKQAYTFDRWGNRTIDQANTTANVPHPLYTVDPANNNRLLAPAGYLHQYDAAGNQTSDTYTTNNPSGGQRTYDAENRMVTAQQFPSGKSGTTWAYYTYNGNGQRVRRSVYGVESWSVYGMDGEVVAEYPLQAVGTSPQREYGYRSGHLLVTGQPNSGNANVQWLVEDHLGTPRMIVDKTGTLASVSRHDYLPFGEELFAGTGIRTTAQGYTAADGVRQHFTQQERDGETGLDFFISRYYSSLQGRFTSVDTGKMTPADPQSLIRYSYVQNNPLKFIDPTGKELYLTGKDADYIVAELERQTGLKLNRDSKTGRVTVDNKVKRNQKGTSTWLANKVKEVSGDLSANVRINTGRSQAGVFFDRAETRELDVDDYDAFKKADPKLAADSLGHVIEEYYRLEKNPWLSPQTELGRIEDAHNGWALEFESNVLSDFTGWWEKPMKQIGPTDQSPVVTFEYSTVSYDIYLKATANGSINVAGIIKRENKKPRKYQ